MKYYDAMFSVTISGHTFFGQAEYKHFDNAPGAGDGFSISESSTVSFSGPALGPLVPRAFFIQYLGMDSSTLSGFSLITDPASLIPLADLAYAPSGFRLDNPDGTWGGLYFTIDQVTNVPEPAAVLLFGTGLAAAGVRRRLKKRV